MIRTVVKKVVQWAVDTPLEVVSLGNRQTLDGVPMVRINLFQGFNGKVLEIQSPASNHVHCDWINEYMLIPEGEDLHTAVATLLLAKGMK